jgi:peptidyl-prolyl cis-trans isomerase C
LKTFNACRIIMSGLMLVFVLSTTGSWAQESGSPPEAVAIVNGQSIAKADLSKEANRLALQFVQQGMPLTEDQKAQLDIMALDNLIKRELLYQAAEKSGVTVSDTELDEQIQELRSKFPDEEAYKNALAQMNITQDELKRDFQVAMSLKKFVDQEFVSQATVPEEEIKQFYDRNPDYFKQPEQVMARHILVKVDAEATDEDKAAARRKIDDIKAKADKGDDFAELAKEYSEGPSGPRGGDLGYFARGQMVQPFEDEAFNLEPGKLSGVVETQFGYHIIKVVDKKPESTTPFDEAKQQIEDYLKQGMVQKAVNDFLTKARGESEIIEMLPERKMDEAAEDKGAASEPEGTGDKSVTDDARTDPGSDGAPATN